MNFPAGWLLLHHKSRAASQVDVSVRHRADGACPFAGSAISWPRTIAQAIPAVEVALKNAPRQRQNTIVVAKVIE